MSSEKEKKLEKLVNYFSRLAKIVLHKRRSEKFHGYFGVTEETPERKTESVGSTNHHEESSNLGKKISVATFYRDTPHVSPGGYFHFSSGIGTPIVNHPQTCVQKFEQAT